MQFDAVNARQFKGEPGEPPGRFRNRSFTMWNILRVNDTGV